MGKGVFCLGENYRPWWCELKWISTQITHSNFTNTKKQLLCTPARQCDALPIPRVVIDSSNLVLLQYCRPIVGCGVRDDPRSELNIRRCALCYLSRCGGMDSCQFNKTPTTDRPTIRHIAIRLSYYCCCLQAKVFGNDDPFHGKHLNDHSSLRRQ